MAEQELMDIEFANGNVLEDVPVGTPREVILDKAMSAGLITSMDQTPGGKTAAEKMRDFSLENLDIPAGLAGAYGGAKIGAAGGPYGAVIGAVVGGATATGAAEVTEDVLQGKEIDYYNAVEQALISAGIDTGLIIGGKTAGLVFNIVKRNLPIGISPDETAREILAAAPVGQAVAGTEESLRATQNILMERGATLTPFQATGGREVLQRVADTGILSQGIGQRNYDRVNEIVSESFDELLTGVGREGIQPSVLGQEIFDMVEAGRQATFAVYERGMNDVMAKVGKQRVNTGQFKRQVERFIKAGQRGGAKQGFTVYDDATVSFARGVIEDLSRMKNMSASNLIDYEKKLMRDMSKFSDLNSTTYNNNAAKELAEMSEMIRMAVQREIKRLDPAAAAEYVAIKKAYGETIEGILPTNLKSLVSKAKEGNYAALGQLAATSGSLDNLNAMLKSIKTSHAQIKKAGGTPPVSLEDAMAKLQEGYLKQLMPKVGGPEFDMQAYKTFAARFEKGKDAEKLKMLFGDKEPKVRQLFNLMSEASKFPTSNIGELMLRTKEYSAGTTLLQIGPSLVGASGVGGVGGVAGGAAILTLPVFLAKAAYNPANVNRMLAFQNKTFKDSDAMMVAAGNLVADIMLALSEEDQAEIRNQIRRQNEVNRDVQAERVSAPIANMVM